MTENNICPQCGAQNNLSDSSCGSCGATLTNVDAIQISTQTDQKSPHEQKRNTFGVLGLVFGVLGLFIFSWLVSLTWIWLAFVFFALCVLGVIFSSISIRNNRTIGVVGLVFNILATLVQTSWFIIALVHLF